MSGPQGSSGAFRLLLRLYPRELRERYAADMEAAFVESVAIVAGNRPFGGARAWIAAVSDLFGAWRDRLRRNGARRSGSSPEAPFSNGPRSAGRGRGISSIGGDLRVALRALRRNPGFTAVAVLTLALGIGANAALFTVVNAVLLEPLPYENPEDLVAINITLRENTWWSASPAEIRGWREMNQVFDEIAFAQRADMTLAGGAEPVEVPGARVSANFFHTLRVEALRGRTFESGEGSPGTPLVAILSYGLWQRHFGGDPQVVGTVIKLDGVERQVVGVLPQHARLAFFGTQDVYLPVQFDEAAWNNRGKNQRAIARLRDGVGLEAAQADMNRVALQMEQDDPQPTAGWGVHLLPLHEQVVGPVRSLLWLLFGAVGFVLLIACANTSNLLLARATSQRREFAVRRALGAGRWRVCRQLLTESCVLAAIGGASGLLLAYWGANALLALAPGSLPLDPRIGTDVRGVAFTIIASLGAGLALGLLPAYRVAVADPGTELRTTGRATGAGGLLRLRNMLIALEIAVVFVLLVGAGLTLRSFERLFDVEPGFALERRLAVRITLPMALYPTPDDATAFFDELGERVAALPGVQRVGTVSSLPFSTVAGFTSFHLIEGRPMPEAGNEPLGGVEAVSPGYFETLRIPLLRGRLFEPADDRADGPPVALINDAMWRQHWPDGADPIGEKILFAPPGTPQPFSVGREVVGVVQGVRYGLGADIRPRVYTPSSQLPFVANARFLVVETSNDRPETLVPSIRAAVHDIDPDQSVALARTLTDWRAESLARDRFQTTLLGLFGVAALLLGAIGVYGVVSYSVNQRRREAGIRMALGASADAVRGWVLRAAMAPVLVGIVAGLAGAIALAGLMTDLLFEIDARDPLTFLAVPVLLLLVAAIASLAPARRASTVDPIESLRAD